MVDEDRRNAFKFLAGGLAAAATVRADFAKAEGDYSKDINEHGTNARIVFKPGYEHLADRFAEHHPDAIHDEIRHRLERTHSSPKRPGPNNSGFEKDVAATIGNTPVPGMRGVTLADVAAIKVWEDQPNRLPQPTQPGVLHLGILDRNGGSPDNVRGPVESKRVRNYTKKCGPVGKGFIPNPGC